jgi:hypothetical protein
MSSQEKGDKKNRAGLTLLGGHQIKEAWAFEQVFCVSWMSRTPELLHPRCETIKYLLAVPLNKKG